MNVNKNKSLTSGGGCGCGGGTNVSVASGCSCNGRGCDACITSAFARPNFFAGQLLTEDDLQQLGDYVVAKNRLHNRFLFGEGVVCGLEVNCHPCGEGRVIVQPGYALDCCGNDLMLSCAKTLDILSMVRELRRKNLGGYDCGDPCQDVPANPAPAPTPGKPIDPKNPVSVVVEETPTNPSRHYCLYIRYCEEGTDPVAPYSTGESCGTTSCQTTRIREGVKFELRCQKPEHPRNDMLARLMSSFDDLESLDRILGSAAYQRTFSSINRQALVALREGTRPEFEVAHSGRMESAAKMLNDSVRIMRPEISAGSVRRSTARSVSTAAEPVSEVSVRATLDAMLEANAITARFYAQDKGTRKRLLANKELQAKLRDAKSAISKAREVLTPDLIEKSLTHPMEKEYALGLLEVSDTLTQDNPPENDMSIRMMANYGVDKPGYTQAAMTTSENLRQWILERLDRSPDLSDCQLRTELERLDFSASPVAEIREKWTYNSSVDAYRRPDDRLIELFARYLRDAVCAALNPTFAPCDDPGVLLACFELKDCEVVSICNLERSFVLSPAAMRYWLAPVTLVGEAIERLFCCAEIKIDTDTKTGTDPKNQGLNQIMRTSRSGMERRLVAFIEEATGLDVRMIMRLGRPISSMLSRPSYATESGATSVFGKFGAGRSETASPSPAPPASAPESTAAPVTAAPASVGAIPFDLTSGVGLAVKERIESMIDARVEEKVSALRKEFTASAPAAPSAPAATAPAATALTPPVAATPAVEQPKPEEAGAAKPTPAKKKESNKKGTAAKEEDAAKDEEK